MAIRGRWRRVVGAVLTGLLVGGVTAVVTAQSSGAVAACPAATGYTFRTIDVPGAGVTQVRDINDRGEVVGRSGATIASLSGAETMTGFRYDLVDGSFTPIDIAGAHSTYPEGINHYGMVSGFAGRYDQAGILLGPSRGFRWTETTATTFADPVFGETVLAFKADGSGTVVGFAIDGNGAPHSFTDSPFGENYAVVARGASSTYATATDGARIAAGASFPSGNAAVIIPPREDRDVVPDRVVTVPCGALTINDLAGDVIAGSYTAPDGTVHGVVITDAGPVTVDVPGAASTRVYGIDGLGEVAGEYLLPGSPDPHGFVGLLPRRADLSIVSAGDQPDPSAVGDVAMETYLVRNLGPNATWATFRRVAVSPSSGPCIALSCSASWYVDGPTGATCDLDSSNAFGPSIWVCELYVPPGPLHPISFRFHGLYPGTYEQGAWILPWYGARDPVSDNNTITFEHTVRERQADVSLSASASPDPVGLGRPVVETYTVVNHGPDRADDVVLHVPAGAGGSQVTPPPDCKQRKAGKGAEYECTLESLGPDQKVELAFTVTYSTPGKRTRSAVVTSTADPDKSNDTTVITTTIVGKPR